MTRKTLSVDNFFFANNRTRWNKTLVIIHTDILYNQTHSQAYIPKACRKMNDTSDHCRQCTWFSRLSLSIHCLNLNKTRAHRGGKKKISLCLMWYNWSICADFRWLAIFDRNVFLKWLKLYKPEISSPKGCDALQCALLLVHCSLCIDSYGHSDDLLVFWSAQIFLSGVWLCSLIVRILFSQINCLLIP